jgi:septal ring-binding cell division protein DamX
MPASITPLLAERLDVSEERARSLLRTLLQELRRRAEADGVQLPELGTFREQDGTLTFEPSPSLRRHVNQPYEGLSAEVVPPPSPETEEALSPPPGAPSAEAPDAAEADARPEPPHAEPVPADASEEERRPARSFIGAGLLVLLLAGAGWFVATQTGLFADGPDRPAPSSSESPVATAPSAGPADTARAASTPPDSAQSPARDSTYAPNSWAIVVASRSAREAAEQTAQAYQSRFDSVAVVAGTVDGTTWYRVAIGWYDSEPDAEEALATHADALPSGAWTHQLR